MSSNEKVFSDKSQFCVSMEPRYFRLIESWFAAEADPSVRNAILHLTLEGRLPDWPAVLPSELRVSRKLAFRIDDRVLVVAGVGLVQLNGKAISISAPICDTQAPEGTVIHDSYVSQLDLHRDPLGGLSPTTLGMSLRRMTIAHETAGFMAIIPKVIGHGIMTTPAHDRLAFLAYSYPANAEKPSAWHTNSDEFLRGVENMARFLAVLHRRQFHGRLCHRGHGFANTLWTTDGNIAPVITGWGQHAGLMDRDMAAHDVVDLVEASIYQAQHQPTHDTRLTPLIIAKHVLRAYAQIRAVCGSYQFDLEADPLAGWQGDPNALIGKNGAVASHVAQYL